MYWIFDSANNKISLSGLSYFLNVQATCLHNMKKLYLGEKLNDLGNNKLDQRGVKILTKSNLPLLSLLFLGKVIFI